MQHKAVAVSRIFIGSSELDCSCCGKKPCLVMHIIMCLFVTFVDGFGCVNRLRDVFIYLQLYFGIYSNALSSVNYFNVTVMQKMNHPLVYVHICINSQSVFRYICYYCESN